MFPLSLSFSLSPSLAPSPSPLQFDSHQGQRLSPPSPGLHRWGSVTSQDSYKATSSKSEHDLRKCLGSDYDEEVLLKSEFKVINTFEENH